MPIMTSDELHLYNTQYENARKLFEIDREQCIAEAKKNLKFVFAADIIHGCED